MESFRRRDDSEFLRILSDYLPGTMSISNLLIL